MMACDQTTSKTDLPTILVVEDEDLVRLMVTEYLEDLPYNVFQATSGDEALCFLKSNHVDLVFSDVRMPGSLNGIELAELISTTWPRLRVVLTSGYTGPRSDAMHGVASIPFVPKPYNLNTVHTVIQTALATAQ